MVVQARPLRWGHAAVSSPSSSVTVQVPVWLTGAETMPIVRAGAVRQVPFGTVLDQQPAALGEEGALQTVNPFTLGWAYLLATTMGATISNRSVPGTVVGGKPAEFRGPLGQPQADQMNGTLAVRQRGAIRVRPVRIVWQSERVAIPEVLACGKCCLAGLPVSHCRAPATNSQCGELYWGGFSYARLSGYFSMLNMEKLAP